MKRTMNEVTVKNEDGIIVISQPNAFGNEEGEDRIFLDSAQIELFVAWLREAKKEAIELPRSE